ncbi:5-oxoprolinase subunit PxpA [uncultured Psychroserpens sp.]|uniref:5-oxoprolinase subunit PxpA n=1 Tax=uncultured Psychroserpens sp. TaxID=255436 RepID=UPI00262F8B42|nr:5-oxoprolinase subunit PxpA [uncultured Psychroserpens sp.]
MFEIDINCDLGEGIGNETSLMPFISSCNVACGGHAGDEYSMRRVVELASSHKVKIGAHPSFPDKNGFGRQIMFMTKKALSKVLVEQIDALQNVLEERNMTMHHVKPHGALYNLAAVDKKTAKIIIDVIKSYDKNLVLYAPYQSVITRMAKNEGLKIKFEAFADRNYNEDLTLVSRSKYNALIQDSKSIFDHVYKIISKEKVSTVSGVEVVLKADTFCMHSDHENILENLKFLVKKLTENNIKIL